jgi:putative membrane protein
MLDGWKPDLLMAVPLAVSIALYAVGLTRVRVPRLEVAAFLAGWCVLVISLLSPIATWSEVLFSVHMTQHELLMLIAAPLIALGRPLVPMMWALPARWRRGLKGGAGWSSTWSRLTSPASVFVLHAAALWVWHVPPLYEAAVLDDRVHALQHVMFTGTAALFWWGLMRGRYGRLGYGAAVFYVFATAMHSGGLGALITFATAPIYPLYVHRAGHGVDPLIDQQLAGLIMWIPAGVVLMIFGLALLSAWLGEAERRAKLLAIGLLLMWIAPLGAQQREITIRTDDTRALGDYGLGVRLGAIESEHAAELLGFNFRLVHSGPATARVSRAAPADAMIPVVAMTGPPSGPCMFVTTSATAQRAAHAYAKAQALGDYAVADWHRAFTRYGAAQLNERFEREFGRPMTAEAWHGWVAVKAIFEAAQRGDDICVELARLRFDGHKGRALRFDAQTRTLIHPALIVHAAKGKEIVEVVP